MDELEWREFFDRHDEDQIVTDWGMAITIEDLYQAFKDRLMDELEDADLLSLDG